MQEFVGNLLSQLLESFKKYRKKKLPWIVLSLLITIFVFLIPYIDANVFYYNRIQKRIEILDSLSKIDLTASENYNELKLEYDSILNEVNNQRDNALPTVISNVNSLIIVEKSSDIIKMQFLTGILISLLVAIVILFANTFNRLQDKIGAFILMLIIGLSLGWVSTILPIFWKPLFNYIAMPILQLIFLIFVSVNGSKSK